jgi:predicted transposase/invertase (TIGR01784 family)
MTLEERYENPYLKAIREGRAEGKAQGMVEGKVEAARNLLKAGVSRELILNATGLTMADLENQSKTAFSASAPTSN